MEYDISNCKLKSIYLLKLRIYKLDNIGVVINNEALKYGAQFNISKNLILLYI